MSDRLGTGAVRQAAVDAWARHLGRPVDPIQLVAELAGGTLPAAFHATAASAPDRPALSIDGEAVSHGELDVRASRTAGWLRARDIARGDRILLSGPAGVGFLVCYLAALRAGATVVLANPAYTEPELRHLADDSGAVGAFAAGRAADVLRRLVGTHETLRFFAGIGADGLDGPAIDPDDVANSDVALLAYTSGTTGAPKGVPLTHANLLSSIRSAMAAWRWSADDVLVHSLPLFHQHGLGGIHATLLAGSRAVIHGRLDPAALGSSFRAERATVLFAVPAVYERLLACDGLPPDAFSSLRLATSGSAPLSPALGERAAELVGQVPLERYGSTEAGLDVSNPYLGPRCLGTVGLPLPGVELAIADERGAPVVPGADGEIVLRGPQVFAGYAGLDETTAAAFHPGGWFRTGDLARVDPGDGFLSVTGRLRELIITGGLNVYPREVEAALEAQQGVQRAAVAGVPSERWGEEVVAFVVPAPGTALDPDDVIATARTRLAAYKCPKRVIVTDSLPVNDVGKVRRDELARMAAVIGYTIADKRRA